MKSPLAVLVLVVLAAPGPAGGPPVEPARFEPDPFFAGRFRREGNRERGATGETEAALGRGLAWLVAHQAENGSWDADGFAARCPDADAACDGPGKPLHDVGLTGLALLALLADGNAPGQGAYEESVVHGLQWLILVQDEQGCLGPRKTTHFTYDHAIATLAMAEACGMSGLVALREPAQHAVEFIEACRNPGLAWRYDVRPKDSDTSVSTWMAAALVSAEKAGLEVNPAAREGMKAWLAKVTEPEYGRVGYTARGTGPGRPMESIHSFPPDRSENLTAAAGFVRLLYGEVPTDSELLQKGIGLCRKTPLRWSVKDGTIDMCYWYWGTLLMFHAGEKEFESWNEAMKKAIVPHQRRGGHADGSWDPCGVWGRDGGRVYSTAMMSLCLAVYSRYPRIVPTQKPRWGGRRDR